MGGGFGKEGGGRLRAVCGMPYAYFGQPLFLLYTNEMPECEMHSECDIYTYDYIYICMYVYMCA